MIAPRRRAPASPPPSVGVLARDARAFAAELAVSEGRVRAWISYMMLAGLLERSRSATTGHRFTIKGGVALELRLRDRARATKDIDLVLHDAKMELLRALEEATVTTAGANYQGFQFRRKREPIYLDNGTISVELAVTYEGGTWTSIVVDLARAEVGEEQIELVPALPLRDAVGVSGPIDLPCLPLTMHIAQKLHGMTLPPRRGKQNERFKDLIDLVLMEPLATDYGELRAACELVFRARGTHPWPPALELPAHWRTPVSELARSLELAVTDAHEAMLSVKRFVDRIRAS